MQSIDEFILPLDENRANIANSVFSSIGGDIEGNSGNPGYSSEISGVISLAGALHRSEYVDVNDVPSVFAHGDDGVVLMIAMAFKIIQVLISYVVVVH